MTRGCITTYNRSMDLLESLTEKRVRDEITDLTLENGFND